MSHGIHLSRLDKHPLLCPFGCPLACPSNLPGAKAASSQRHPPSLPSASSSASLLVLFLCPSKQFSTYFGFPTPTPAQFTGYILIAARAFPAQLQRKLFSLPTSALLHNDPADQCTCCRLISALPLPSSLSAPSQLVFPQTLLLYPS